MVDPRAYVLTKSQRKEIAAHLQGIRVGDMMSSPVQTIKHTEPFSKAEELFVQNRIRHLPVVDEDRKLIGVISQRDVYRALAPRRFVDGTVHYREGIIVDKDGYYEKDSLNKYILQYVMSREPITATPDQPLKEAIDLMVRDKVGCITVVNEHRHVIGIITRYDLLEFCSSLFGHS